MRRWWLVLIIALGSSLDSRGQVADDNDSDSLARITPADAEEQESRELSAAVEMIVSQTQAFRQEQGRDGVEVNPQLTETAEYFAQYMAETDEYGHEADGRRPSERAKAHGYDYCLVSENIGHLFSTATMSDEELARQFVKGWQESPEHRKNMLEPAVTEIGVAIAQSPQSGYFFAVQMFGRPESAAIRFEISNQTPDVLRYQLGERTMELPPQYTRMHKRCRTGEITFLAADAEQQDGQTLEPRAGDRLTVVQSAAGQLEIRREDGEASEQAD